MTNSERIDWRPALLALLALPLAACTSGPPTVTPPAAPPASASTEAAAPAADGPAVEVAIASSDLAAGAAPERFAFALLDSAKAILPDASLRVTFFRIEGDTATQSEAVEADYYASAMAGAGLYIARTRFDQAGTWGAQIEGELADGRAMPPQRIRFVVAGRPASPAVGETPPPTANRVLGDGQDLAAISSDPQPDPELYRLTVDEARRSGRPTLVVFATPGLCQSKICMPVMDEVKALRETWQDRVNFIHIEVYRSPSEPDELAPEMEAWGLTTEPWIFLLDASGAVSARLEGSATAQEIEPLLAGLTS